MAWRRLSAHPRRRPAGHPGSQGPRGRDSGASAVEFALILPVLLLLLLGIIDFGRLTYERLTVTQAAFEGARASGFKRDTATVTAIVNTTASPLTVNITNTTNFDCTTSDSETTVTVARPTPFTWYTPLLRSIQITVSATGAYRCLG